LGPVDTGSQSSASDILFQLEENFRMNPQLCNFVELIYQKKFQPFQPRRAIVNMGHNIAEYINTVPRPLSEVRQFLKGMSEIMRFEKSTIMKTPRADRITSPKSTTMFIMNLNSKFDPFTPAEVHVAKEAKLVAELVRDLSIAFVEETIFVVTPHRVQRSLVTKELNEYGLPLRTRGQSSSDHTSRIWVDTTERMQGLSLYISNLFF
jgi:superfamily I DNA and/or RNA helicase